MSNIELSRAERLDQYVARTLPIISRAYAAKLIETGKVSVNQTPVTKAGYKLRAGDRVAIDFDPAAQTKIPHIELPVIYEDNDCIVIDKPVGLLAHSKGVFNPEATVASWLRQRLMDAATAPATDEVNNRAGIVHRLDRATSGVMICAKTPAALVWLQKQFSQRRVKKTYIAIVKGAITPPQAIIDMPIERNPKAPQMFRVGTNGKAATTEYRVLESGQTLDLIELKPQTGRTHQLRVHLEHLGHPILGDEFYGGQAAERLFLHALSLEITLPDRERRTFEAPLPAEFKRTMQQDA